MASFTLSRPKTFLTTVVILLACVTSQGCASNTPTEKGANNSMKTRYIGRFSIAVPSIMEQKIRTSNLGYVAIKEVVWPKCVTSEQARIAEWERFMSEIKAIKPPKGKDTVIIKQYDFPEVGKWIKGMFYFDGNHSNKIGTWTLLMDAGPVGVWFKSDPVIVEKELTSPKTIPNFENIAKAYHPPETAKIKGQQPDNRFYLKYGAINMPYLEQEGSVARFEGHHLNLSLLIEMEMDFTEEIEPMGLIKRTKGLLAASLITPGGSISKIRLQKREVAGMPGEEAVLRVKEGDNKHLVFNWEYNGKDDSGEYPTTRIKMESPGDNLDEKLKIWDAILDSMKPMFERKK